MTDGVDANFLRELESMFEEKKKSDVRAAAKPAFQDQAASHAGVFSSSVRQQPRFEAGAAQKFDNLTRIRTAQELQKIQATAKPQQQALFAAMPVAQPCDLLAEQSLFFREVVPRSISSNAEEEHEEVQGLVLVNESMMECGFAGDDAPRAIFPAIVGRPRHKGVMVGMGQKDSYVGDEAQSKRGILTLKYPLEHGVVTNWDDMEKLWHHSFYNELRCAPEEHHVLLSEPVLNPTSNREKLCQIMFETFNVPALLLVSSAQLVLVSSGKSSGVVLEIGEDMTTVAAIRAGRVIPESVMKLNIGGRLLVEYLTKLMSERGYSFTTTAERDITRDILEKLCYVAADLQQELATAAHSSSLEKNYELPDGQVISVGNERFRSLEALFEPSLVGVDGPGLDLMIAAAIAACPANLQPHLWKNVVVAGRSSSIQGLTARLQAELIKCSPMGSSVSVLQPTECKHSAWIGGSILASMNRDNFISKDMYDQQGPQIIARCIGAVQTCNSFVLPRERQKAKQEVEVKASSKEGEQTQKQQLAAEQLAQANAKAKALAEAKAQAEAKEKAEAEAKVKAETAAKRLAARLTRPPPNPNALHVPMAGLNTQAQQMSQQASPVRCESCTAFLSYDSHVDSVSFEWCCEFCHHVNLVALEPGQKPSQSVIEYIHSPPTGGKGEIKGGVGGGATDHCCVIFCLDNSGSMCEVVPTDGVAVQLPPGIRRDHPTSVNRMECLQAAVHKQLDTMKQLYPSQRPVVISFCSDVRVYIGEVRAIDVKRVQLGSFKNFFEEGQSLAASRNIPTAKQAADTLNKVVDSLKPESCTALGPALSVALGIASKFAGSKIILCTDGAANLGVGSLGQGDTTKDFYTNVGLTAKEYSAQISVLSIRGTNCEMEMIGIPAEITRGSVDVVNPLDVSEQFSHLLARQTLGTAVSGCVRLDKRWNLLNSPHFEVGSVTADSDLVFAFERSRGPSAMQQDFNQPLRAQLQLHYTRADGAICTRVVSRSLSISEDRDDCERALNAPVIAMTSIQEAAELAQAGSYLDARCKLISTVRMLQRAMFSREQQQTYISFIKQGERLDGFMRIAQERSKLLGQSLDKRDDTSARNIMQMKTVPLSAFKPEL
eukprot:gb/GEZN01000784.1/.p1 GENE.gb/GEZN01000784.1/~~gb/GEZN01000784.1/.p1  ORF type:complete len:1229 (-),score=235.98 gb/GEZN01000784.1/:12-3356(-)